MIAPQTRSRSFTCPYDCKFIYPLRTRRFARGLEDSLIFFYGEVPAADPNPVPNSLIPNLVPRIAPSISFNCSNSVLQFLLISPNSILEFLWTFSNSQFVVFQFPRDFFATKAVTLGSRRELSAPAPPRLFPADKSTIFVQKGFTRETIAKKW